LNGRNFLVLHAFLEMISGLGPFQERPTEYYSRKQIMPNDETVVRVLELIKSRVPQQFLMSNTLGYLPLHVAVRNTRAREFSSDGTHVLLVNDAGTRMASGGSDDDGGDNSDNKPATLGDNLNRTCDTYGSKFVNFLLQEHPESVHILDGQGRLPLHVAAEHGLPCYDIIADAEPRALTTRCLVTHLYPFQLPAFGLAKMKSRYTSLLYRTLQDAAIDMTYTLLRKTPHLIHGIIPCEPWVENQECEEIERNILEITQLAPRSSS